MDTTNIVHKLDPANDGCGVLVGDLFLTAGHVLKYGPFAFRKNNNIHSFNIKDAILCEYMEEDCEKSNGADIAVFKQDIQNSPLQLSKQQPFKGQECISVSFHNLGWSGNPSENPYDVIISTATILEIDENFFLCKKGKPLRKGASGSPLFNKDGEIIGILTHGDYDQGICVFMSSVSILNRIAI